MCPFYNSVPFIFSKKGIYKFLNNSTLKMVVKYFCKNMQKVKKKKKKANEKYFVI